MAFQILGTDHLGGAPEGAADAAGIEQRMAEVLQQHQLRRWNTYDDPHYPYRCHPRCNLQFKTTREHTEHVAAMLAAELNLAEEWGIGQRRFDGGFEDVIPRDSRDDAEFLNGRPRYDDSQGYTVVRRHVMAWTEPV